MKNFLAVVLLTVSVFAQEPAQYRLFARAVAKQEGFFIKGSLPNRNHNPGDLKSPLRHEYPGQIGLDRHSHVIFKNDYWGWAALENQVRRMCVSDGRYNANMSIQAIGRIYAADWKRWSNNVARNMGCSPKTTLAELFDIPPAIRVAMPPLALVAKRVPTYDNDRWNAYRQFVIDSMDARRHQLFL